MCSTLCSFILIWSQLIENDWKYPSDKILLHLKRIYFNYKTNFLGNSSLLYYGRRVIVIYCDESPASGCRSTKMMLGASIDYYDLLLWAYVPHTFFFAQLFSFLYYFPTATRRWKTTISLLIDFNWANFFFNEVRMCVRPMDS